jgi:tetratricopeptide (TPR) repeat protein
VQPTSLVDGTPAGAGGGAGVLDGFESTAMDFSAVRRSAPEVPPIHDEIKAGPVDAVSGLEPTAEEDVEVDAVAPAIDLEPEDVVAPPPAPPPPPAPTPPPAPPKRKTVVEVPPLDLEPDFDSAAAAHSVDEEPLVVEESDSVAQWITTEEDAKADAMAGRGQGFIDLGLDGVVNAEDQASALILSGLEESAAAAPPSVEALEARVADNPDDPDAHRSLGEALIEAGERERGIEELDLAAAGYESSGGLPQAQDLLEEVLRLDPNSVRHRQKAVEYAFKTGEKARLIDAYLELADTLLRGNLPEKARAVYERVAEHDAGNVRAKAALNMLAPPPPATEGRVSPKDAKMRVRDEAAADAGDFVDLGALVLEEDDTGRDSRMKVEDEAPSGDEERDFQDMLARFRQGIDENIDETDFQSHYDLGVAFKEMGLLDEAIAEFQKALRAPEGKLRTSEALGVCFLEKGALSVAESILRRGLELPVADEKERLGILYWLGRALEGQTKVPEARQFYERVCAVDIRFMDVGERVKALARA